MSELRSNLGSEGNKDFVFNSEVTDNLSEYISSRLQEAGISVDRGIELVPGQKNPDFNWRDCSLPSVDSIDGNYALRTGDGLVVFDVDDWGSLPDEIKDFLIDHPTLVIRSPHSKGRDGHYYFATDSDINRNPSGLDIQGDGSIIVGPGSRITDCKHGCCSSDSQGEYIVDVDRPILEVPAEKIEEVVPQSTKDHTSRPTFEPEKLDIDRELVDEGFGHMRSFNNDYDNGYDTVHDLLIGGRGDYGDEILRDDGCIDRSKADEWAISLLFGIMKLGGESDDRAIEIAYHVYSHFCQSKNTKWMKDSGDDRKWNRDENYRMDRVDSALNTFSPVKFIKWINKSERMNIRERNNEYSRLTYTAVKTTVDLLYGMIEGDTSQELRENIMWSRGYLIPEEILAVVVSPTMSNRYVPSTRGTSNDDNRHTTAGFIGEFARHIDQGEYKKGTYEEACRILQRDGQLKMAKIDGTFVYYPLGVDDPPDADFIRCRGEEFEPGEPIPKRETIDI